MWPKKKRYTNSAYLRFVAAYLKCLICHKPNPDPHHVTSRGAGGGDEPENIMPLCREHHAEFHKAGVLTFIKRYKNAKEWAKDNGRYDLLDPDPSREPEEN